MKRTVFSCALGLALLATPAEAALLPGADFAPGGVLGAGAMGVAADYALGPVSLGVGFRSEQPSGTSMAARVLGRFYHTERNAAAVVGGVWLDPGYPGNRGYMVPDLGLALSHRFEAGELPILPLPVPVVLRAAVTLTAAEQRSSFPGSTRAAAGYRGHFFQRLSFGPNSHVGVGLLLTDNIELTLGSGTAAGLRLKF